MALIVVAEDDPTLLTLLQKAITSMGHLAIKARNGRVAFDFLRDNHAITHLLITDIMMPEMDGLELLDRVRNHKDMAELPVIIQSAYLGPQATKEVEEKGASCMIHKPLDLNQLRDSIDKYRLGDD